MLVRFTVENWMCFREPVTFSMIASRERQHGKRVPVIKKYKTRILPISALYGGNASGKTCFVKALDFARFLVLKGSTSDEEAIPVDPFALDPKCADQPSRFVFEILVGDEMYEFSFSVTRSQIVEEKLIRISTGKEHLLYERRDGGIDLDRSLPEVEKLDFVFEGTRDNQLFLQNTVSQRRHTFRMVHEWFQRLTIISPQAYYKHFDRFMGEDLLFQERVTGVLSKLDTGIKRLHGEDIPLEALELPSGMKSRLVEDLQKKLPEGRSANICSPDHRYQFHMKKGQVHAKKLVTYHASSDETKETKFEINQESDGTRRIFDLLPAFLEIMEHTENKVYIIDEIDRSLHTLLTRQLLDMYLGTCTHQTRSQLLFTTHDVLLMDQDLFRRDEMWVAERKASGASVLIPFSEYRDIRYDKDIRKSYLQGRLGGIPRLLLQSEVGS